MGLLVVGLQRDLGQLLSCSEYVTCRNTHSMSTVNAIRPSRNLNIVPVNPCSRPGADSCLSFRQVFLYFDAALQTRLTLPGLLWFSTELCGKYRSFPKLPFALDSSNILTIPFSTTVSTDCCYEIFRLLIEVWAPLEFSLQ